MLGCYNQVDMPLTLILRNYEANSHMLWINPLIWYQQTLSSPKYGKQSPFITEDLEILQSHVTT